MKQPIMVMITAVVLCSNIADAAPADTSSAPRQFNIAKLNSRVVAGFHLNAADVPHYVIRLDGNTVLRDSLEQTLVAILVTGSKNLPLYPSGQFCARS